MSRRIVVLLVICSGCNSAGPPVKAPVHGTTVIEFKPWPEAEFETLLVSPAVAQSPANSENFAIIRYAQTDVVPVLKVYADALLGFEVRFAQAPNPGYMFIQVRPMDPSYALTEKDRLRIAEIARETGGHLESESVIRQRVGPDGVTPILMPLREQSTVGPELIGDAIHTVLFASEKQARKAVEYVDSNSFETNVAKDEKSTDWVLTLTRPHAWCPVDDEMTHVERWATRLGGRLGYSSGGSAG
jgi:hypothetical protein